MPASFSQKQLRKFLTLKEIVMLLLAASSVLLVLFEHFEQFSAVQLHMVDVFEIGVSIVFLCEFLFELHYAKNRTQYVRHNWYLLLAAIPISTQTFEYLHGVRALRLIKLLDAFAHMRYEYNTRLLRIH